MVDLGEESLENVEEVFQRIHTMKGEDNLDVLVTRFIQGESLQLFKGSFESTGTHLTHSLLCCCAEEDRNFAHYNFVNEQNNEAQALKDRISQVSFSPLVLMIRSLSRTRFKKHMTFVMLFGGHCTMIVD